MSSHQAHKDIHKIVMSENQWHKRNIEAATKNSPCGFVVPNIFKFEVNDEEEPAMRIEEIVMSEDNWTKDCRQK